MADGRRETNRLERRAGSICAVLAALALSGCGGGGGGGSDSVMLAGDEAVEASVGVGLSTGAALAALFLDVELSIDDAMTASAGDLARHGAGGGAGTTELPCELGGRQSTVCGIDSRGRTTIDLDFSSCRTTLDGGRTRDRDGRVRIVALDPLVCLTGELREGVPFSLRFDGFRSTITDGDGGRLAAFAADLTEDVTLESGACLTSNGTRSVAGSLDVEIAGLGIDLSLDTPEVAFVVGSSGSPCEQRVVANGQVQIDDRANRLRFSQILDETDIRLAADGGDLLIRIDGEVRNDCLGDLNLVTIEPARLKTTADACPTEGSFSVTFIGGTTSDVRFRADGGVDFDFDSDGSADVTSPSCRDASLAQCSAG